MSTTETVADLLEELRLRYDKSKTLFNEWQGLQTIEEAQKEYQKELASEEEKLAELKEKLTWLDYEINRLILPLNPMDNGPMIAPPSISVKPGWRPQPPSFLPASSGSNDAAKKKAKEEKADQAARHKLKKLVNRWADQWQVDNERLGQINRIAADKERLLGEALILLDWSSFESPLPRERPRKHLARLKEWGDALQPYHEQLIRKIENKKRAHHTFLGIWKWWRMRNQSHLAKTLWLRALQKEREAKQLQIVQDQEELNQLQKKFEQLKAELDHVGGS